MASRPAPLPWWRFGKSRANFSPLAGFTRIPAAIDMGRHKHLIGPKLRARTLSGQQGEVAIGVSVLNRMIRTGKPVSVRA